MFLNKRGVALLQVLIVTAILAGMATMVLRVTLTRQLTSRQMRHTVTSQMIIEACMAEVNNIWAAKESYAYNRDLSRCQMCHVDSNAKYSDTPAGCTTENQRKHVCEVTVKNNGTPKTYIVVAEFTRLNTPDANGRCELTYTIKDGIDL